MQIPTSQTIILINFFRYLQSIYFNQLLCRGSVLSKIIHSILQIYRVNIFHKKNSLASYYQHDNHDREFFPSGDWEVLPEDEAEELPLLMGGVEDA